MSDLKSKSINGLFWVFMNMFGVQAINFVVSIILARLLAPAEFGLIGMISLFINVGTSLVDSGMTSSLIRTPNPDQKDYSTVFFTNMAMSLIVYLIAYVTAPFMADFYGQPILTSLIRVYCLVFIVTSFTIIQGTKLNKEMNFKKQLVLNIPSLLIGSIIGIYMAYHNYGVWSIVWMNLSYKFFATIQLWLFSRWLPTFEFELERLKTHWFFGYKLTLSGIIGTVVNNVYNIVIGRYFSATQLGFYTRAKSMQELPVGNISNALNKVTYPMFAAINHDNQKLKEVYLRLIQQVFFWITPIMLLCIVTAEPMFRFLLTEKWLPAVPYFRILCLVGVITPLNTYNLNILLVKGQSDKYLKLIVARNVMMVTGAIAVIPLGISGLMWSMVGVTVITFFMNAFFCGKMVGISVLDQLRTIFPILGISIISAAVAFIADYYTKLLTFDLVRLGIMGITGLGSYLLLSVIFKFPALNELKDLLKKKKKPVNPANALQANDEQIQ